MNITENEIAEIYERHALQLAACDVAALSNTPEAFELVDIERSNPAWSAAYQSVRDAVTREMSLRAERDTLKAALEEAHALNVNVFSDAER